MNDIPFTELIAKLLEINLEDQSDENPSDIQEDEKEKSANNITDGINVNILADQDDKQSKKLEEITSMAFNYIDFEKFKTFMEKCSQKIESPLNSYVT